MTIEACWIPFLATPAVINFLGPLQLSLPPSAFFSTLLFSSYPLKAEIVNLVDVFFLPS